MKQDTTLRAETRCFKTQTHTQFYVRRHIFLNNALNKAESSRKG